MRRPALAALVLLLLLVPQVHGQGPGGYLETFDRFEVSAPTPLGSSPSLGVLVHSRDRQTWRTLEPMAVGHGPACEAPPATHPHPQTYDGAVFLCNDHLMTAISAGGYGLVYLTPAALADFTDGEAVIRFDSSTLRTSARDWIDLWVTPYEDAMAAPLPDWLPDLSGYPRRGLHVEMVGSGGVFRGARIDGHVSTDLDSAWWAGYESVIVPSAQRRDTFELRISRTHVTFRLLDANGQPLVTWVNKDLATPLDWTRGVVQIGHHSYNPVKACTDNGLPPEQCPPNTWHFDNLSISPSAPLVMIPAQQRWANEGSPTYTFAQPAPQGAVLQMHALATSLDYSLDNGATWAPMGQAPSNTHKWGGMRTWRQSIPAGTTGVTLRGVEESGSWEANHAAILSEQAQQPPTPTPPAATPTSTPTGTPTPVPPTATPGPTDTPVPVPTNTSTPVPSTSTPIPPTATPTPEVSATATPFPSSTATGCTVTVSRAGTPIATWECQ